MNGIEDDNRRKPVWDSIWIDGDASFKYLDHFDILNFVLENIMNVNEHYTICDIGGGTGFLLEEIGRGVPINIDISKIPLELSKRRGIHSVISSATHICIKDRAVDLILCNFTLGYISDRDLVLKEIRRILIKGGRCIFLLHHSQSKSLANLKRKKMLFNDLLDLSKMLENPDKQNLDKIYNHLKMLSKEEAMPKIVTNSAMILLKRYLKNPEKQKKSLEELTLMFREIKSGTAQIKQYETLFKNAFTSEKQANEFFQKKGFLVEKSKIFSKDDKIAAIGIVASLG